MPKNDFLRFCIILSKFSSFECFLGDASVFDVLSALFKLNSFLSFKKHIYENHHLVFCHFFIIILVNRLEQQLKFFVAQFKVRHGHFLEVAFDFVVLKSSVHVQIVHDPDSFHLGDDPDFSA